MIWRKKIKSAWRVNLQHLGRLLRVRIFAESASDAIRRWVIIFVRIDGAGSATYYRALKTRATREHRAMVCRLLKTHKYIPVAPMDDPHGCGKCPEAPGARRGWVYGESCTLNTQSSHSSRGTATTQTNKETIYVSLRHSKTQHVHD